MIITLLFYSLLAEALSFVIPDEKIESLCRFEVDFRIAHILRYPSNSNAFGHRGHNILQWQFLFWHGNRIISSQTRYKWVLFVHSCGRRHFKQSVSSRQRLSIFSSGITNERASASREIILLIIELIQTDNFGWNNFQKDNFYPSIPSDECWTVSMIEAVALSCSQCSPTTTSWLVWSDTYNTQESFEKNIQRLSWDVN